MSSSLIIGQYVPGSSIIHRIDPRTKITIVFFFIIFIFLANSFASYMVILLFSMISAVLSKIPPSYLIKGLKPVWFLIIFTFLLHILLTREGDIVFSVANFHIYSDSLTRGVAISLRFFFLILMTTLLTLTTSPIAITDAIESMLNPLRRYRFPVHELALMMSISLRFIPTLMQETEKISKAQASRGVDFRTGTIRDRLQAIIPLLVPLFVSAFKRAEELAMAMEARGYQGGEGRTKYRQLLLTPKDYISFIIFSIFVLSIIVTRN
ncbi:energy-coupling factor transporter transmembrane component T family protein [Salirhabdus salicampi]|uniref:energy-coupling factor transporter transmembrane component T family protein n=1 Tax=Salirhabdus salicampi TaxID=476102 RepID=UPI0020C32A75|nr:energy-coupling factor transporter transmembrane protein EcfT [Salirhabdus salicampi]MCP8618014.1 energy-coupling factor transporter transmembrane protein EcfT [Salirhabdus salicampi]